LKNKIENIEEVTKFVHSFRSDDNPTASPVFHIHGDYTEFSGKDRLRFVLKDKLDDWIEEKAHFGIVNVWRPIGNQVEKSPLGFLDPATLSWEDVVNISYIYPAERPDVYQHKEHPALLHNAKHRWLVLDKMMPDMVWIFRQYDSQGLPHVPHSAVELVGTPETAKPRRSIESRMVVKYTA